MALDFDPGKWEGEESLEADALLEELRLPAERAVKRCLVLAESEVKKTLTGTRSGRTYRVPMTKGGTAARTHVASAPGEPPAVLFGNLRNSIGHTGPKWVFRYTVEGEYGPGIGQGPGVARNPARAYARRLEYGGVDSRGIRILPRPYMEPTAQRIRPRVDDILEAVSP